MPEEQYAIIAVLIMDRPTCLDCIASKSDLPAFDVKRHLVKIGKALHVVVDEDRCRACGDVRVVFSLSRP